MNCPACDASLRIAKSHFESALDSTDVYNVHVLVCVNPICANHETNLENPTKIVETVGNKLN